MLSSCAALLAFSLIFSLAFSPAPSFAQEHFTQEHFTQEHFTQEHQEHREGPADIPGKKGAPARAALVGLQEAFADVAERIEPAVVTIFSVKNRRFPVTRPDDTAGGNGQGKSDKTDPGTPISPREMGGPDTRSRRSSGTGSGVLISSDGWVLTNDHVVGGADRVTVRLHDGREFAGTVRRDRRSDLAVVKIESQSPFPFAPMGDSDRVKIGHWAIAVGSPYRYEGSFSLGVISSLGRRQQIPDSSVPSGTRLYSNMIQTDAAINPGNSGGPLCNIDGEIIGINTAIESETGGSIGIGFAIPANIVRFVSDQLRAKGHVDYGYLGVSFVSVTAKTATALKTPFGALIDEEPIAETPAAAAGLHVGDVITALNGRPMHNDGELRSSIGQTAPGTQVEITIVRAGEVQQLRTTLGRVADDPEEAPAASPKPHLGLEVSPANAPSNLQTSSQNPGAHLPAGVVVTAIDPNTPASEVRDLKIGATILRVNGKDTPTVQAFQSSLANIKSGDQVILIYIPTGDRSSKRLAIINIE